MKQLYAFLLAVLFSFGLNAQCVQTMPYTENFDGSTFVQATSWNTTGSINSCWSRNPTTTGPYVWIPGPPFLTNNFTGPSSDHTSGTGKFMYLNTIGTATPPVNGVLLTPYISLVNATAPELIFWYHMFGNAIGSLSIEISSGGSWTLLQSKGGQQHNAATQAYTKSTIDLTSYVGDTIRIRFKGVKSNFSGNARIAIDDISVAESPTCPGPTNLYTTNTTVSSTELGWNANTGSTYEIEYGPAGFTIGSGTFLVPTSNPQTITGLNGSTSYEFYMREICSSTDTSYWIGPATTTTACSGPLVAPYFENFDSPSWEPYVNFQTFGDLAPCWLRNPTTQGYAWRVQPNAFFAFQTGPNGDHTTGNGKYLGTQRIGGTTTTGAARLRSPAIDLSATSNPELTFWYHMYGNQIDKLEVQISNGGGFNTIHTITGQQQSSSSSPWQSISLSLQAYTNDTIYIRFRAFSNATFPQRAMICIDDLSITPGSNCPKPLSFAATNITFSTVDLSWTAGPVGSFEVKYGALGFDPDLTGTSVSVAASPTTISGLTPGTDYDFYVRKLCTSINDTSTWAGPISVMTNCLAAAPYTQNFDSGNWTVPPNNFSNGTIDDCWNRTTLSQFIWAAGPEQFTSFQTGPATDHTTGSGKFMFTNSPSFGGTAPITALLTTEFINLSPLTIPELTFWYHMFGNQMGSLKVEINNGSGWTQIYTKTGQQNTSKTDSWLEATVNLSGYADDTIQLRFTGSKAVNAFNSEMAIDDVDIHEQPSCPKPSNLAASAVTFNSANVGWTTGGASNWLIKYGAPGFTSGTFVATSSNPNSLTGLTANTQYEIWVKDSCGIGDVSAWVGPIIIRTQCAPTVAPYSEDFDGTNFTAWAFANQQGVIDDCFRRTDTIEYYWVPGPAPFSTFQTGPDADASGSGKFMYTRTALFNSPNSTTLISPWIDISSLTLPELRFKYHMYGNNIDKLEVRIRSIDGTTQIITTKTGQQHSSGTAAWTLETNSLSSVSSDTIRLEFIGYKTVNGFRAELAIDEVEVSNPQNCSAPTALTASNITLNSVQLNWTSTAATFATNIEYGPTGFTPGIGSGTVIYGVTSPYIVAGLLSGTAYQFYIQDSCSWGGLSPRVGPVSATTLTCPSVTAAFTTVTNSGLSVDFNGTSSSGTIDHYDWDFGDGNSDTTISPTHVYAGGGTYVVTLIVSNNCGNADTTTMTITICDLITPLFNFSTNGLTINLDGSATTGTGLVYSWTYGDGNSGTGVNSSHTYAQDGNYLVTLVVTDTCGNVDSTSQSLDICNPVQAVINYTQNGLNVLFDGTASSGAVQWQWFFGDGSQDTVASPSYTYASTGTYQITLYTTNLCGDRDTAIIVLTLCETPEAAWTFNIVSSGANGMVVQFDGTASIGASSFEWDFGDGNQNTTSAIPVHTYNVPGLFYVVTLTVSNSCGDENSTSSSLASVGIEDFEEAGMIIFPQPVDDQLVLNVPSYLKIKNIELYSTNGNFMPIEFTEEANSYLLETSSLAAGNYLLKVDTDAGEAIYRVVVRH